MNKRETVQILAILRAAYPSMYSRQSQDDLNAAVNLWQIQFASDEYPLVEAAVQSLIATKTDSFAPTIGAVKAKLAELCRPDELTEGEAWGYVLKAIKNSTYHSQEEWEKMPADVRRCITPQELHEYALTEDLNLSVVSSNFMRTYKARTAKSKEESMLPSSVIQLIEARREQLRLEAEGQKLIGTADAE